jgi:hypothetical protein
MIEAGEAYLLAELGHANIDRGIGYDEIARDLFLIMRRVEEAGASDGPAASTHSRLREARGHVA